MSTANLGMHKLGYFQVSSIIPKGNFHESAQNNSVEQHSEQSKKPSSQQGALSKLKGACVIAASWATSHRTHSSISCWLHFLTQKIWYRYLYTKNYKAVNSYHWVFVTLKVLIQTRVSDGLRCELYAVCLYRELWVLDALPPFFHYELLIMVIIHNAQYCEQLIVHKLL